FVTFISSCILIRKSININKWHIYITNLIHIPIIYNFTFCSKFKYFSAELLYLFETFLLIFIWFIMLLLNISCCMVQIKMFYLYHKAYQFLIPNWLFSIHDRIYYVFWLLQNNLFLLYIYIFLNKLL
ncbi:hypothetical protein SLOPH_1176, partial [Spraguea lophii 42_110]